MNTHFDEHQLDAILAHAPDTEQAQHLEACATCRSRYEELAGTLATLRAVDTHLESLPEHFWSRQRHAIHSAAAEYREPRFAFGRYTRFTWAGAAAAIVLFVASMWPMFMNEAQKIDATHKVEISDAELLQSVEDRAYSDPEAIHPAQMMYSEIESAQLVADGRNSSSPKKGNTK
jgi:predicted anti-sigma-YlaC factor YlaD